MNMKQIASDVYYVGVNDRREKLFENLWPLPCGVSYNAYLVRGEKTVLIDTVDAGFSEVFLRNVEDVLGGRSLDYLIIDHMEPDHSGSIHMLRRKYPDMRIIGNKLTFGMLAGYYGITDGLQEVNDGDTVDFGSHTFRFFTAPMVHWPEVMFAYDATDRILFSADAFGSYGALNGGVVDREMNTARFRGEMLRYYSNIVGKYGSPVRKALQKLAGTDIRMICSTHGPVWTDERAEAIAVYDRLSRYEGVNGVTIVYGSMYGHAERMAETVAAALADGGVRDIAVHNVSVSHASYILRDLFNYKGVIIGCPTYSNGLFPEIDALLGKIETREIKNRLFGCFGTFTWAGVAAKRLAAFGEAMKWETVGLPVEQKQNVDTWDQCTALGRAMAERLRQDFPATPLP
jgi:flavorubredoxin